MSGFRFALTPLLRTTLDIYLLEQLCAKERTQLHLAQARLQGDDKRSAGQWGIS